MNYECPSCHKSLEFKINEMVFTAEPGSWYKYSVRAAVCPFCNAKLIENLSPIQKSFTTVVPLVIVSFMVGGLWLGSVELLSAFVISSVGAFLLFYLHRWLILKNWHAFSINKTG